MSEEPWTVPEPPVPFSAEVALQPYLDVIDNFCREVAALDNVPHDLLERREVAEFWRIVLGAI